jgi:hypothetical protein
MHVLGPVIDRAERIRKVATPHLWRPRPIALHFGVGDGHTTYRYNAHACSWKWVQNYSQAMWHRLNGVARRLNGHYRNRLVMGKAIIRHK